MCARGAQVGRRAHAMLAGHMQRFCYSAMGALRWKRDVTEYADVLRNSHSPTTNAQARARSQNRPRALWNGPLAACAESSATEHYPVRQTRVGDLPSAARMH